LFPREIWQDWLKEKEITNAVPVELADGTWQVSLPASAFRGAQAKFATTRIGDYELRQGYFIQIWCDDVSLRREAVLDRTLRLIKKQQQYIKRQTIQEQLRHLAEQLHTRELEFTDLRQRAMETGKEDIVSVLDSL
jgi:hypothetical protein